MSVQVHERLLQSFLKRAKSKYPAEHIEEILGRERHGHYQIVGFHPIKHKATGAAIVELETDEFEAGAKYGPLLSLGTIHTHPRCADTSPSQNDWEQFAERDEIVSGICCIWRDKPGQLLQHRFGFYLSQALLTLEVKS